MLPSAQALRRGAHAVSIAGLLRLLSGFDNMHRIAHFTLPSFQLGHTRKYDTLA